MNPADWNWAASSWFVPAEPEAPAKPRFRVTSPDGIYDLETDDLADALANVTAAIADGNKVTFKARGV